MGIRRRAFAAWALSAALAAGTCVWGQDKIAEPAGEASAQVDLPAIVKSNNQFALDMYGQLRRTPGNVFFSPYSVSTALSMLYPGSREQTLAELDRTLRFTLDSYSLGPSIKALIDEINVLKSSAKCDVQTANALWPQKGLGLIPAYVASVEYVFGGRPTELDYAAQLEAARAAINDWTARNTKNKIQSLLAPGVLSIDTKMVLTNAIYFKAAWSSPFRPEATRDEPFAAASGESRPIPMMIQDGEFLSGEDPVAQYLELPYEEPRLAFVIALPKAVDGLAALEELLTEQYLSAALAGLSPKKLELHIPRFTCDKEASLAETLKAMGMQSAFSAEADFSGMAEAGGLALSAVIHKAFVDVNEQGSEAAAATAAIMQKSAFFSEMPPVFRADHPFVFLIRDRQSGAILFLGRLCEPETSAGSAAAASPAAAPADTQAP